jgi:squalene-hopene/tetraprenyl-beta-curcumene cyclase
MSRVDPELRAECVNARAHLAERLLAGTTAAGIWEGELSSSALATAVAIAALAVADRRGHAGAIARGVGWLTADANDDGGWGDSPESRSNLSTTTLAWCALALARAGGTQALTRAAEEWIRRASGSLEPSTLTDSLASSYGADRTFSAPILTVAALSGRLGEAPECWQLVPQLPFELAALPHRVLSWLRLPVVSYALPALIAIGLVRHRHMPSRCGLQRALREALTPRLLARLAAEQPRSGGFLEATPLTAFVTMSLAACGLGNSPVAARGVAFLLASQRPDGSWPIDSNLATWVTTLAVKALAASSIHLPATQRAAIREWLLRQQQLTRHPFTHAAPGGFAWTDLPGGVPDADDTAGALLALHHLDPVGRGTRQAAARAIAWLAALQNSDGGTPTFCRGWGRLPFDRSCPDITAHALRAVEAWRPTIRGPLAHRARRFTARALRHLVRVQQPDGAWLPLWFGNQWQPDGTSGVYGTAQVVLALAEVPRPCCDVAASLARGVRWLACAQNADGGWGRDAQGASTIEETGLTLAALAGRADEAVVAAGARWLTRRVRSGDLAPAPIGLYFASLWYSERLYPLVFALMGLGGVLAGQASDEQAQQVRRAELVA